MQSPTQTSLSLLDDDNHVQGGGFCWPALITDSPMVGTDLDFSIIYEGLSALIDDCKIKNEPESRMMLSVTNLAFGLLRSQAKDVVDLDSRAHSKALRMIFEAVKVMMGEGVKGVVLFTMSTIEQSLGDVGTYS